MHKAHPPFQVPTKQSIQKMLLRGWKVRGKKGNQSTSRHTSGPLATALCIILASSRPPRSLPAQVLLHGKPSLESAGFLLSTWPESKNESATLASGKTVPSFSFRLAFFMLVMSPRQRGAMASRTADWTERSTELGRARLRHLAGRGVDEGCGGVW